MINVGVVGAGYWGPNLIRNFVQIEDAKLKYVCDLDEGRLKKIKSLYPAVETTTKYDDLLNDKELDAVVLATNPSTHFPLGMKALKAGKHLFVEKPLTLKSEDAKELIAEAEKQKKTLMVGHTFEYTSAVNKIKELIDSGELGEIFYIYISRLNLGLYQKDTNVIWDLAPHDISIINYLLKNKPVSVNANANTHIHKGIPDVAFINIKMDNGIFCHLHVSWLDPMKVRKTVVVGSRKMVVYDDIEPLDKIRIYDRKVEKPDNYETFGGFQMSYKYGDTLIPKIAADEPLNVECRHFLDCIKTGKKPRSNGEDGLMVVRIMEAAEESIAKGGAEVKL